MRLQGKHILLGVTGSIAAYKAAVLIRLLVKEGAEVRVVMTPLAKSFITPLTLATLCKQPILVDFFDPENGSWNSHVSLGLWADAYLIAPATANTLAKMANGIADNLLLTSYLSARCKVFAAPAMDLDMYRHPATQNNLQLLRRRGVEVIEATSGALASGLEGQGRMEEPEKITEVLVDYFEKKKTVTSPLEGKSVLITAGPTYEKIDPVRYLGNFSSGKMGFALALELANRGAKVFLVSGPTHLSVSHPNIEISHVTSAAEMLEAALARFGSVDGAIMAAAVADYTPAQPAIQKMKRGPSDMSIPLIPTTDIAATLGRLKTNKQVLAGFALETQQEEMNAVEKLKKKQLDFIVLNSLNHEGAGFQTDTNRITIYDAEGGSFAFKLKPKSEVASDIADKFSEYFAK